MTKKKTIDEVVLNPKLLTSYEKLAKASGNDAFNKNFSRILLGELEKDHTKKGAMNVMSSLLKGVKILNKATFYSNFKYGVGDIGREAWRTAEDDIKTFATRVIFLMKLHQQRGDDEIDLSSVLFYLAFFKGYSWWSKENKNPNYKWKNLMAAQSIAAAAVCSRSNPFVIKVAHPQLTVSIQEALGLPNLEMYRSIVGTFIDVFDSCYDKELCRDKNTTISFPRMEFLIPVEQDARRTQVLRLASLFAVTASEAKRTVEGITSLSTYSPELEIAIEKLKQKKGYKTITLESVIELMKEVEDSKKLMSFPELKDYHRFFAPTPFTKSLASYKKYKVTDYFVERESFLNNVFNEALKLAIDCSNYNYLWQIEPLIFSAAEIIMTKETINVNSVSSKGLFNGIEKPKYHIELRNVKLYDVATIAAIKEMEKNLCSRFLKDFVISIGYDNETATSRFGISAPTHIRVISDIHADVNRDRNYLFDFGSDFVVNCGDTASNAYEAKDWIRTFIRRGVFVAGNHLGYTSGVPEINGPENISEFKSEIHPRNTREGQISYLMYMYPGCDDISTLSNYMVEREGIIFIGTTLYTDFKLFGEQNQAACMMEAAKKMNDFRLVYRTDVEKKSRVRKVIPFTVEQHAKLFETCRGYIRNRLNNLRKENNRKPIVIVTHHCPLPFCISEKYKNSPLSAAFASDMRDFIKQFPEIRLWCSGHVHDPYDFIYNETRFVCEPWGYFNENGFDEKHYGNRIAIEDIKNRRAAWRGILKKEIEMGIVKDYGYCE